ncbi:MAG: EexN family lipoprotein [Rickettsia endosymbiont of Ecitomorpha arachnoides]|nr:EexN family lipoprotein [Rickettsia endosymbiont of Ecitomorpha arachnoides]
MHKFNIAVNLVLFITFLSACSEKVQTVDWYLEHREKLEEVLKKCELKSPAEFLKDANCNNAQKAKYKIYREHQRNAPIPTLDLK